MRESPPTRGPGPAYGLCASLALVTSAWNLRLEGVTRTSRVPCGSSVDQQKARETDKRGDLDSQSGVADEVSDLGIGGREVVGHIGGQAEEVDNGPRESGAGPAARVSLTGSGTRCESDERDKYARVSKEVRSHE